MKCGREDTSRRNRQWLCALLLASHSVFALGCAAFHPSREFVVGYSASFAVPEGPCGMGELGKPLCQLTWAAGVLGAPAWVKAVGPSGVKPLVPGKDFYYEDGTVNFDRAVWCGSWSFIVSFGPDKNVLCMRGRLCEEGKAASDGSRFRVGGPDAVVVAQPYSEERPCTVGASGSVTFELREFGSGLGGQPIPGRSITGLRRDGTSWPLGVTDENGRVTVSIRFLQNKEIIFVYAGLGAGFPVENLANDSDRCFHQVVLEYPVPFP